MRPAQIDSLKSVVWTINGIGMVLIHSTWIYLLLAIWVFLVDTKLYKMLLDKIETNIIEILIKEGKIK
jgi:hypothetical protein